MKSTFAPRSINLIYARDENQAYLSSVEKMLKAMEDRHSNADFNQYLRFAVDKEIHLASETPIPTSCN